MSWQVLVPKRVKKNIQRFPAHDQDRIISALRDFEIDPWCGDVAKTDYENTWRRRVGN